MKRELVLSNIKNYLRAKNYLPRLRVGQSSIFEELCHFFRKGFRIGYLKLPSGVGKTNLAIELTLAGGFQRVLFLVPTLTLVKQTQTRYEHFSNFATDIYTGFRKKMCEQITIATYLSIQRMKKQEIPNFDLVIWDEAHEALTPSRQKIIELFDRNTIHLGLTASDQFNEDKQVKNFMPRIAEMEIEEAIKLEMLCAVRCWLAQTNIDISRIKSKKGDYDLRLQKRIIDVYRRNQMAVETYLKYLTGQICLVTCINIEHAIRVAELFREAGVAAEAVWGSNSEHPLSRRDLETRLENFRIGKIKVLTTVDLIDKGFDNTLMTALINLRITSSVVKATQRGGRVLRLFGNNDMDQPSVKKMINKFGGKLATVVDFLDDCHNHAFRPVLFSDILHGTAILPPAMEKYRGEISSGGNSTLWPVGNEKVKIKLITDLREVARITSQMTLFTDLPVANEDGIVGIPVNR